MNPFALQPDDVTAERIVGCILCHDVVAAGETGRIKLKKGRILGAADAPVLESYSSEIHLLRIEASDVHEDVASLRLARAVAGPGIELHGPVESQTQLRTGYSGLLEVHIESLRHINELPDVSVFTAYDGQPVKAGKAVGATKVTPLAINDAVLRTAEAMAETGRPVVSVCPYQCRSVGVVVRDRVAGTARDRFEAAIHMKIGWFGSPVAGIEYLPEDVTVIGTVIEGFIQAGAGLVLAAGVNSTDPLDLTIQALHQLGAITEKRGVPAHPGSTCWLSYLEGVPIFGLALCGMFSRTTVLDLLLPRFLSGRQVDAAEIATLGHGGLLNRDMAFRFPNYTGYESR